MFKKIALNVFYNLAIIVCILGVVWCFNNERYPLIAVFVAIVAFFVYLKLQLIKEMRNSLKK